MGDEELAKLVATASALTESEGETDTETEAPEGERVPAVGSDSISEASSNAPVKVRIHLYYGSCTHLDARFKKKKQQLGG